MPRTPHLAILLLGSIAALAPAAPAQSLDDLKIQVHGFATQGFLFSTKNSWNTSDSESGSAAWNEDVVNVSAQPQPKLRIGVQARFFLLGDLGNKITIDWAQGDYQFNDRIGVRFGKVKTPVGLFNDSQDIDPAQLWILLPQSIYPLISRNSDLAHYGGVVYGKVHLGESFGSLEYRGFAGQRLLTADDGYFQSLKDYGFSAPNGSTGTITGATLRWNAPLNGLFFGASEISGKSSGEIDSVAVSATGQFNTPKYRQTYYFAHYEHSRFMVAGEFSRLQAPIMLKLPPIPEINASVDPHAFYAMASVKATEKLSGGLYFSSFNDHQAAPGPRRYQKDWTLAARYDFNPYVYAKAEQHFLDGTALNFVSSDNPNLSPDSRLTLLKVGVSF